MQEINIGGIIRKKLKEKGIKIKDFAIALPCNRGNVYSIFRRKNIDLQLLDKISQILGCDLLSELQTKESKSKNILIIETDDFKMNEIQSDSQIRILYAKSV